jgi:hypothetical protein
MLNAMYKTKQLNNGLWYVLVSFARTGEGRIWIKTSERGFKAESEAEAALCRQLDAEAAANCQLLDSEVGCLSYANVN